MFSVRVKDPDNEIWHVGLVIVPSREGRGLKERFFRKRDPNKKSAFDFIDIPFIDSFDEIWVLLLFLVAALFMAIIGWPLILVLFDLAWLVLVMIGAVVSFGILRRPITIRAYAKEKSRTWQRQGFRAALSLKNHIAEQLAHGVSPEKL
jgi:hypothetical protein